MTWAQPSKLPMVFRMPRHAGGDPRPPEREAGGHQAGAVLPDPGQQVRMAEALAQPRLILVWVQPDADHAARDLVRELRIVARGDPDAADREAGHLGLAEHPVLPVRGGERRGHGGRVQLPAQVVDQEDRGDLAQLGGQALAPLVLVAALDHDAGAACRWR